MKGDLAGDRWSGARADAARWGAAFTRQEPEDEGIWPAHVDAAKAFLAVATQWRMSPSAAGGARAIGLDYTAARAGLELAGIAVTPEVWAAVRCIESGAIGAMNGD